MQTTTSYYDGPGLGMSALGQAADSLSPVTVTVRPTGALIGAWWSLSTVSGLLSAYHGFKRNNGNLGWALAWFLAGSALPVVVPVIAFTQGFGQPEVRKNKRSGYKLPRLRRRSR
jgi:hypothetical protein